jgi:Domain of unknown function (DUF5134)
MTGPGWLTAGFAGLMLLIAGSCAVRVVTLRRRSQVTKPEADVLHVLMGVAMAGMLEPQLSPLPDSVWRAVFALSAAWFAWRAVSSRLRRRIGGAASFHDAQHAAPHAAMSVVMVYMLVPGRSAGSGLRMAMAGMSGSGLAANPAVALLLVVFMLGYILWTADQLAARSRGGTQPVAAGAAAPGVTAKRVSSLHFEAGCTIAMSIAMGYMLLPML